MKQYVIIGASAAGIEAARELRHLDSQAEITILSSDKEIASRCMLHKCLGGERSKDSLRFIEPDFFEAHQVKWLPGTTVTRIDETLKRVVSEEGNLISYDKLLIATGADYYIPPIPNLREGTNVFGFRSISDMDKIREALLVSGEKVVVIGGGLVGMDMAYALCEMGKAVTVVEMAERIMPLQTDEYASGVYRKLFEEHGCRIKTGISVKEAVLQPETGKVTEVLLANGETLECDLIVAATSVKPKIDFLQGTSIQAVHMNYHINTILNKYLRRTNFSVSKGMEVDAYMKTTSPDIYAAGDVTGKSSIWPDARIMGRYAARSMAGKPEECTELFPNKNTSNFWGTTMLSLGRLDIKDGIHEILVHFDGKNYRKIILQEGCLEGVLFVGDLSNAGVYLHLIQSKICVEHLKKKIFRLSFADFYEIDRNDGQFRYSTGC